MSSPLDFLLSGQSVSMNHLWTTESPIFAVNPVYNITNYNTHQGTFGAFPGGISAAAVALEFSGQHGAPTIDALGHIAVNGTGYGGIPIDELQGPNGLTKLGIDEYPVDKYLNRAVLVDIPYCKGVDMLEENYIITQADVEACLDMEGAEILEGDSVLIRTGYGAIFNEDPLSYVTNFPGPSGEVATFLADKKIFLTGVDNLAWDAANTPFPAHAILIPLNGIYIVENINLEEVSAACAERNTWEFAMVMNPPKIKGAAAGAANSFAIFPGSVPLIPVDMVEAPGEESEDMEEVESRSGPYEKESGATASFGWSIVLAAFVVPPLMLLN